MNQESQPDKMICMSSSESVPLESSDNPLTWLTDQAIRYSYRFQTSLVLNYEELCIQFYQR